MSEYLGAWLRQQREVRSWTKREMARQLIQAGRSTGDTSLPGMDSMCHNIHRWERGQGGLTERYKLHYCNTFGIPPDQFGADPAVSQPSAPAPVSADLTDPRLPIPLAVAYRGRQDPQMGDFVVEREVLMAAHEGSEHATSARLPLSSCTPTWHACPSSP